MATCQHQQQQQQQQARSPVLHWPRPTLWNSLALTLQPLMSLMQFCARLKTEMFCRAYTTDHSAYTWQFMAISCCANINSHTYIHTYTFIASGKRRHASVWCLSVDPSVCLSRLDTPTKCRSCKVLLTDQIGLYSTQTDWWGGHRGGINGAHNSPFSHRSPCEIFVKWNWTTEMKI